MEPDTINQIIKAITYSKLLVTFEAIEDIELAQEYKGGIFRGSLLRAIMEQECLAKSGPRVCKTCNLRFRCNYFRFSVNELQPGHSLYGKNTFPPKAYILNPLPDGRSSYSKGSQFAFEIILVGEANGLFFPLLTKAFQNMGENGLGMGRKRFRPVNLEYADSMNNFKPLSAFTVPQVLSLAEYPVKPLNRKLKLNFITPLRFMSNDKPLKDIPTFDMLCGALFNRIKNLAALYCGYVDNSNLNIGNIKSDVIIENSKLKWCGFVSFSSQREKLGEKSMYNYEGNMGTITYSGELQPWSSLITAGEVVNAGAAAIFGLGKYKIIEYE